MQDAATDHAFEHHTFLLSLHVNEKLTTSNSAVHILPELCNYKEKTQTLSVSGE